MMSDEPVAMAAVVDCENEEDEEPREWPGTGENLDEDDMLGEWSDVA